MNLKEDILQTVNKFCYAHNNTTHRSLGTTPSNLVYSLHKTSLTPFNRDKIIKDIVRRQQIIREQSTITRNKNNVNIDFKNKKVMIKAITTNKLQQPWNGPYAVKEVNYNYGTCLVDKKNSTEWIPYNRLKPFKGEAYYCTHQ